MSAFEVLKAASRRLEDIYLYTEDVWGEAQAEHYIQGLFARFEAIAERRVQWRALPAAFGIDGYVARYAHHYIYWRALADGTVGIITVLHERMHQLERLQDDL